MTRVQTTVHLIRHGEVYNPTKVLYGRLPGFRLSDTGVAQAKVTCEFLAASASETARARDVALLLSSPLERAQQTAEPFAAAFGAPVGIDPRLIESSNAFEGGVVEPGPGIFRHPQHWPKLRNPFRPSWGEPYEMIAARMMAAVHDARVAARGREAVLVSHQLPVFVTRRKAEARPLWHRPDRRQCALASVTSLVFESGPAGGPETDRLAYIRYCEPNGPGTNKQGTVGA
jgi:broad specificity phosphatase PhoE